MYDIEEQRREMIAAEKMLCVFKEALNEWGFDFGCTEVKVLAAQQEKPKREIDGDEFQGWYVDEAGWAVRSDGEALDSDDEEIKAKIEKLIAASPDAMRVMVDFVNYWDGEMTAQDFAEQLDRFRKIITDAGFGSDIARKERDNE